MHAIIIIIIIKKRKENDYFDAKSKSKSKIDERGWIQSSEEARVGWDCDSAPPRPADFSDAVCNLTLGLGPHATTHLLDPRAPKLTYSFNSRFREAFNFKKPARCTGFHPRHSPEICASGSVRSSRMEFHMHRGDFILAHVHLENPSRQFGIYGPKSRGGKIWSM